MRKEKGGALMCRWASLADYLWQVVLQVFQSGRNAELPEARSANSLNEFLDHSAA